MVKKSTEEKKKTSFRNKKEKDVIYPILQECMTLEKESGWAELFNNMSRGMCPKGIIIQNGTVSGSISKKNTIKYNFLEDSPEVIIDNIKSMFSNLLNVQSDNKKRNKEFDDINEQYNDFVSMQWKSIKKKAIKDLLLQNYIIELKNKFNFKSKVAARALDVINNALYFYKTHNNNDIIYSNGKVIDIVDIIADENGLQNKRISKYDNLDETNTEEDEDDESSNNLSSKKVTSLKELWESYLKNISKN